MNISIRRSSRWCCTICTPTSGGAPYSRQLEQATVFISRRVKGASERESDGTDHGEQTKNDDGRDRGEPRIFPRSSGQDRPGRNHPDPAKTRNGRGGARAGTE